MEEKTISEGLGIEDSWFDEKADRVIAAWQEEEMVSQVLKRLGQEIKDEEFETGLALTEYEKKLILAGYITGQAGSLIETERKLSILMKGLSGDEEKNS